MQLFLCAAYCTCTAYARSYYVDWLAQGRSQKSEEGGAAVLSNMAVGVGEAGGA